MRKHRFLEEIGTVVILWDWSWVMQEVVELLSRAERACGSFLCILEVS